MRGFSWKKLPHLERRLAGLLRLYRRGYPDASGRTDHEHHPQRNRKGPAIAAGPQLCQKAALFLTKTAQWSWRTSFSGRCALIFRDSLPNAFSSARIRQKPGCGIMRSRVSQQMVLCSFLQMRLLQFQGFYRIGRSSGLCLCSMLMTVKPSVRNAGTKFSGCCPYPLLAVASSRKMTAYSRSAPGQRQLLPFSAGQIALLFWNT